MAGIVLEAKEEESHLTFVPEKRPLSVPGVAKVCDNGK